MAKAVNLDDWFGRAPRLLSNAPFASPVSGQCLTGQVQCQRLERLLALAGQLIGLLQISTFILFAQFT
ncbi:hypothetical protein D3C76_1619730 [compost metagenome]